MKKQIRLLLVVILSMIVLIVFIILLPAISGADGIERISFYVYYTGIWQLMYASVEDGVIETYQGRGDEIIYLDMRYDLGVSAILFKLDSNDKPMMLMLTIVDGSGRKSFSSSTESKSISVNFIVED